MFGLPVLDIAIGLIFIYLIYALTCTAISELIAGWLDRRANNLFAGISNLLTDDTKKDSGGGTTAGDSAKGTTTDVAAKAKTDSKTLLKEFYSHPLITSLKENGRKPSYIPSRTFALTLLDLVAPADPAEPRTITDLRSKIQELNNVQLKRALTLMLDDAGDDLKKVQTNIEIWFNNSMERVSAWYKTRTHTIVILIALFAVLATNADTIRIGKSLSNDKAVREALVAQAQEYVKTSPAPEPSKTPTDKVEEIKKNVAAIQGLGVPLGYNGDDPGDFNWWLAKILGLLLTVGAVSLGAPFWFDMLNKFINVRSAGKSPDEVAKPPEAPPKRKEEIPPK